MSAFARALIVLGAVVWSCQAESSFNFEIARRTTDNVQSFLSTAYFPNSQVASAFATGMLNLDSANVFDRLRRLMYTQYLAVPLAGGLTTTFTNGSTISFKRESEEIFVMVDGTDCTTASTPSTCGSFYKFDSEGNLAYPAVGQLPWNATLNQWYETTKATNSSYWSKPYLQANSSSFAIAYSTPIYNMAGNFIGVTSTELTLASLDAFLNEYFGNEPDGRVVFITESNTNNLIASSPLDSITQVTINGVTTMVDATTSPIKMIREASIFLNNTNRMQEVLYVHNGYYVQSTPYVDTAGISWDVVVVRPADSQDDFIVTGSTTYYVICVVASLSLLATAALIVWVVRFRKMNLWKAAQPSVLVMILISNMLCVSCAFVLMGAPSKERCLGRQWMICLSITFTCAAFLAKILRVYVVSTAKMVQVERTNAAAGGAIAKARPGRANWLFSASHVVFLVLLVLVAQIVLLGFWTGLDPMKPNQHYKQQLDVLVAYETCGSSDQWGMAISGSLIAALFIGGCYLSFLTRNYSEMFAESRALMMTFYHGAFISLLLVLVALFANVSTKSMLLFVVMSMVWFTITTQAALFMPRIYRQVTLGDFTMWEMREMVKQHLKVQSNAAKNVEPDMNFGGVGQPHVTAPPRVAFGNGGVQASTPSERPAPETAETRSTDVQYVI